MKVVTLKCLIYKLLANFPAIPRQYENVDVIFAMFLDVRGMYSKIDNVIICDTSKTSDKPGLLLYCCDIES